MNAKICFSIWICQFCDAVLILPAHTADQRNANANAMLMYWTTVIPGTGRLEIIPVAKTLSWDFNSEPCHCSETALTFVPLDCF